MLNGSAQCVLFWREMKCHCQYQFVETNHFKRTLTKFVLFGSTVEPYFYRFLIHIIFCLTVVKFGDKKT